ncbi:MAG: TonB-dependent receptor, partial [Tepidisphaeraceae bacterium]
GNFQVQPGTRLLFTPDDQNSFWTAVSRSVRIPSLYQEENLDLGGFEVNHRDLSPEQTISYEAGYKTQPAKSFTADITGFYNSYRDLINYTPLLTPTFIPYGVGYDNTLKGDTYGTEVSANWQVTEEWRLSGSYSLLKAFVEPQNDTGENVPLVVRESVDGSAPQNQYQLHSYLDITKNLQFNTSVYYVDALPTLAAPPLESQKVPEHTRLDLNLQWEPRPNLSFTAGVQNLLQNRHSEFGNFNSSVMSDEIQRSYFVRCSWSF